jgi:hypothetical protein
MSIQQETEVFTMKRLLPLLLALLSGIAFSACSLDGNTDHDTSVQPTPQQTGYSYAYLNSVMDDINAYFQSFDEESYWNDKLCQIMCGASIADGHIDVGLTEPTDENIALFKEKVSDSDAIIFKKSTKGHLDSQQR